MLSLTKRKIREKIKLNIVGIPEAGYATRLKGSEYATRQIMVVLNWVKQKASVFLHALQA